jgi:hypothetical protein
VRRRPPTQATPAPADHRAAAVGSAAILAATGVGLVLLAVAMRVYPGGSAIDRAAAGHSFWFNFLCDLTADVAGNGRPNHPGATFAWTALLAFSVALGCFWMILPAAFAGLPSIGTWIRILGGLSVAGLLAVPLTAGGAHVAAVFTSSIPALGAGVLGIVGGLRASRLGLAAMACATVAASAIDSLLYAWSYLAQPRVPLPALPLFQRIAFLLMIGWMGATAIGTLRAATRRGVHGRI